MNYTNLTKIAPALLAAQQEMGAAVKDSSNPFFKSKFADLNAVREAVIPALHKNGITVLQPTVVLTDCQGVPTKSVVRTMLLHTSGEAITSDTEIVCLDNKPQTAGSAISYARRYGLQSLLCVGTIDDDGETAMGRDTKPTATTSNGNGGGFGSFRKPAGAKA